MRKLVLVLLLGLATVTGAGEQPAVRWEPVPHFTQGRHGQKIDMIVIHTVEGSAGSCLNTFRGDERKVSAHYLVAKDGSIVQCVKDEDTAWHAGAVNRHSIGIEHEGFALRPETWTDANYAASAKLTRSLCDRYQVPIDRQHIVGHSELPGHPHGDPGPHFDWTRYMNLVRGVAPVASDRAGIPLPSPEPAQGRSSGGVTGALAQVTKENPAPAAKPTDQPLLERGSSGEHVRELQKLLNGDTCTIAEDGIYGPETEKAVRAFQKAHGCKVDGIVGPETWGALGAKAAAK